MRGRMFALVNPDDETDVFGVGFESTDADRTRAVIAIPERNSHPSIGVHASAEGALKCWSRIEPLELTWR